MYIDENQILSAYGKKNLQSYLENNDFELIYKKRETALNEGVQYSDIGDFSDDNVAQKDADVKYSLSDSDGKQLTKYQGRIAPPSRRIALSSSKGTSLTLIPFFTAIAAAIPAAWPKHMQ